MLLEKPRPEKAVQAAVRREDEPLPGTPAFVLCTRRVAPRQVPGGGGEAYYYIARVFNVDPATLTGRTSPSRSRYHNPLPRVRNENLVK